MTQNKIKTQTELIKVVKEEKETGKIIGFTNGCFDILHLGHVKYLAKAKAECDVLIIGVNSDSSVKSLKGPERPLNSQFARIEVLAALECVDLATLFEEDTPEELIKSITPDILFKGGDWEEENIAGALHVKSQGGRVKIISFEEGYSTTSLIDKIKEK